MAGGHPQSLSKTVECDVDNKHMSFPFLSPICVPLRIGGGQLKGTACAQQENYGSSSAVKRTVKYTLKQMMEAGRITCRSGLYKLSGIPQQLVEESTRYVGDEVVY